MNQPTYQPSQSIGYAQVEPQTSSDLQHLNILAICTWVWGGMVAFFSCFAIIYIVLGALFLAAPIAPTPTPARSVQVAAAPAAPAPAGQRQSSPQALPPVPSSPDASSPDEPDAAPGPLASPANATTATPFATPTPGPQGGEKFIGAIFLGIGGIALALGWLIAALNVYSGFCLKRRRRRIFSVVVAGINCLSMPVGTALGVFTMIVLFRDSVVRLYEAEKHNPPAHRP